MALSESKLFKWYEPLPPYVKGIVIVGGLIGVYLIGNTVYKKLFPSQAAIDAQNRLNQATTDLSNLISQGTALSFQGTQYNDWADSIAAAFSGCDFTSITNQVPTVNGVPNFSDSASTVYNITHQLKNDADFLGLQKAFGIRTISKGWECGGDYTNVDLSGAVNNQLSQAQINYINADMGTNGISYKF
jgi:hypothetical protein